MAPKRTQIWSRNAPLSTHVNVAYVNLTNMFFVLFVTIYWIYLRTNICRGSHKNIFNLFQDNKVLW